MSLNGNNGRRIVSGIRGVGAYVPERKMTNEDVQEFPGASSAEYLDESHAESLLRRENCVLAKSGNVTRYGCEADQY